MLLAGTKVYLTRRTTDISVAPNDVWTPPGVMPCEPVARLMDAAHLRRGAIGVVGGAAWLGGLFVAEPLVGGFAPVAVAQGIIVRSPGWLSTTAIALLGFYAKPVLLGAVVVGFVATTALAAVLWPAASDRAATSGRSATSDRAATSDRTATSDRATQAAIAAGVATTAVLLYATGAELSLGFAAGLLLAVLPPYLVARWLTDRHHAPDRRPFLRRLGGVVVGGTVSLAGLRLLFDRLGGREESDLVETPLNRDVSPPAGDPAFGVEGMPAAVTPPDEHYVVDINVGNPVVDPGSWTLDVEGAVARPYRLSYDELRGHEASVEQTTTMVCISNQVGGDLIGTGHWTGVQLSDLVAAAEPSGAAVDVVTHAVDGYSEAIPIDAVEREDVLVAYGLGDRTLATAHGFPARLLVPGRYGMKMTKWIDRIEVAEASHEAYWETRGWNEAAVVNTTSYVRGAERSGDAVTVGGVAFGGLETGVAEIAAVEVSVDGGDTWHEAELEAQLAPHAWRRWRYEFHASERDTFEVVARAVRTDGTVQTSEETSPRPNGATGWHHRHIEI